MALSLVVEVGGIRMHENPASNGWGVLREGIDGWWDSPETRDEDELIPGADGAFESGDPLLDVRRVTVRGAHIASSPQWAITQTRDALSALSKKPDLGFRVWEAGRWLTLRRAHIRGSVKVTEASPTVTLFELTVRTADPLKYGMPAEPILIDALTVPSGGLQFPVVDGALNFGGEGLVDFPGAFVIRNPGTAPFFPTFTATGPMKGFTIESEGAVIEFTGTLEEGRSVVLSPYLGGRAVMDGSDVSPLLTRAEWAPVEDGTTRGYLFTPVAPGGGAQLRVDHPLGAWI